MIKHMNIQAWIQAARLPSQSYIFIPLLLGQSFFFFQSHNFDFTMFLLIQSFGIANQLYIVFANDYADQEADKLNKTFTIFSGGSRVLVDNKLAPKSILSAALIMAGMCVFLSAIISFRINHIYPLVFGTIGLILLQMYSFRPFRLSYKGGGEFLQMLGVGFILPIFGYLGQGGSLQNFPFPILLPLLLINLSCSMATSLPDTPSDKTAFKNTFAVRFGIPKVQSSILILELLAQMFLLNYISIARMDLRNGFFFLLPTLFVLLSFIGKNALPGTVKLSIFVFFSITYNLSFQVLLILKNFRLIG